jgi:YD repeat-containing protein
LRTSGLDMHDSPTDGLRRLVGTIESPGSPYAYTYDLVGNRTQVMKNSAIVESGSYDAADQVTDTGWQYDAAGDLLSDGTNTYTYDALKRLTSVAHSGTTTTYGYNGENDLATETVGATATRYTLDTTGGLPERLGATTDITRTWYVREWGQELLKQIGGLTVIAQVRFCGFQ